MAKWVIGILFLLLVAGGAVAYWLFTSQQADLTALEQQLGDRQRLLQAAEDELTALRSRVADLESVREQLQQSSSELQQRVAAKEAELGELRSAQDELVSELQQEIADQQVQVRRIRDQLRVDMVEEVLFDSGEATLKPAGIDILKKVGAVLKKTKDRTIEVQGHTDNVPIRGALARRFPTNWELSAARSVNVVRFLQEEAQVDPGQLSAVGFSEYRPRASNDTEEGRRQNRRIEILLGPVRVAEKPAP